jgi:hypothetical chaperone protein
MGFDIQACGIDFGTSNSTLAIPSAQGAELIALEGSSATLPSAVFWDSDGLPPRFGRDAIAAYTSGEDGRLMRGLKSTLGSSLIHEKTRVGNRALAFTDILGAFFGHLRKRLEAKAPGVRQAVLGRPVHFVDDDADGDAAAQAVLESIARAQGFTEIAFQYEPIAAALEYETRVTGEELVLIVDIGGGTSDFSICRVSPGHAQKADRSADILGNHGIRVGGTDFDRLLSLSEVMPMLGLGSLINNGKTPMPLHYYHDLATWHRINTLYASRVMTDLRQIRYEAARPDLIDRLMRVIEERHGHSVSIAVEEAKIALSTDTVAAIHLAPFTGGADATATRAGFEEAVAKPMDRIAGAIADVLAQAGLRADQIGTVFTTGGSSSLPALQACVAHALPGIPLATGDLLGSVGTGLALDARRRFA